MFGLGSARCVVCDGQVPRKEGLRGRDRKSLTVCLSCNDRWDGAGRICALCKTPVRGGPEIGVFRDGYTLVARTAGQVFCAAISGALQVGPAGLV